MPCKLILCVLEAEMTKRNVAIFIFEEVEVLDFAGPFEVFSVTSELNNYEPFNVYTVAEEPGAITTVNGLSVNPKYCFLDCPRPDILILPGGVGSRAAANNPCILEWVKASFLQTGMVFSVCSGARILARSGLLDRLEVTTHHEVIQELRGLAPTAIIQENVRFIDNGRIMTSAGISAGIDLSLHVVRKLLGEAIARKTANYMEYHWQEAV
jgi:transcriptional regulator GlxA family with amidase domain